MSLFLGGTGSANELHDYEEGNWTATFPNGLESGQGQHYARYVKVGRLVWVSFEVYTVKPHNNSSEFRVGGLPFTCRNSHGFGNFAYVGASSCSAVNLMPIVAVGQTYFYFHRQDGTSNTWKNNQMRSTSYNQPFILGHMYETDS